MKRNYSIKRIVELEAILLHLFWKERNKRGLSKKEVKLQTKLSICLTIQKNKFPLAQKLI